MFDRTRSGHSIANKLDLRYIYVRRMQYCMCICVYTLNKDTHIPTCMHACMQTDIHAHGWVCKHVRPHIRVYFCTGIYVCMLAGTHVHTYVCLSVCLCVCMHVCMYVCTDGCLYVRMDERRDVCPYELRQIADSEWTRILLFRVWVIGS